jgi:hypothetical protein
MDPHLQDILGQSFLKYYLDCSHTSNHIKHLYKYAGFLNFCCTCTFIKKIIKILKISK